MRSALGARCSPLLAGSRRSAPPSRSSGRSRAPATSSTGRPRASRSTPRAACGWPPPARARARPRGALRLVPGPRRARARSTSAPATTARSFAIEDGKARSSSTRRELEVHALAVGPDGRLYVGTSPDGKVYAVDASGKAEAVLRSRRRSTSGRWPSTATGRLLVATGAEGQVYRVDRRARRRRCFATSARRTSSSLAQRRRRATSTPAARPAGIVYRDRRAGQGLRPPRLPLPRGQGAGRRRRRQRVRGGRRRKGGGARPRAGVAPAAAPRPAARAEVTVTETFALPPPAAVRPPGAAGRCDPARAVATKGALLRIAGLGRGRHAVVLDRGDAALAGLGQGRRRGGHRQQGKAVPRAGRPHVGHGGDLPGGAGDRSAARRGEKLLAATSNPGQVHVLDPGCRTTGEFTSKVQDTETVSTLGPAPLGRDGAVRDAHRGADAAAATPAARTPPGRTGRSPTRTRTATPSPASGRASSR